MITAAPHIARMTPYALADLKAPANKELLSLSQNESFRPPSPSVADAVLRILQSGMLYPDPDWTDLRHGLAARHGISADRILCGNGSLDLIGAIAHVFAGPNRSVLASRHAYPYFQTAALRAGAEFITAAERDLTVSVSSLLDAVTSTTSIVFVANPGNPTGTRISRESLLELRAQLRDDILLVVDEAYGEFADHLEEPNFDMVDAGNTVVLRTFSKAYGMAGFRVGWGVFPVVIASEIRKVLNPNNVAMASQAAALAALEDHDYMRETCEQTNQLRDRFTGQLSATGFKLFPSFTNFVLIDCGIEADAVALDEFLRAEGIFLRRQAGAGLPHCLRLTIGPEPAMELAVGRMMDWKRGTAVR